jgi:hypothetical protein
MYVGFNPLNAELHPICRLLALLGAHHILHVRRIRVKEDDTNGHLQLLTTSDAKMRVPKSSFALRVELFHAERTSTIQLL